MDLVHYGCFDLIYVYNLNCIISTSLMYSYYILKPCGKDVLSSNQISLLVVIISLLYHGFGRLDIKKTTKEVKPHAHTHHVVIIVIIVIVVVLTLCYSMMSKIFLFYPHPC